MHIPSESWTAREQGGRVCLRRVMGPFSPSLFPWWLPPGKWEVVNCIIPMWNSILYKDYLMIFQFITLMCKKCHILYYSKSILFCSWLLITRLVVNLSHYWDSFFLCGRYANLGRIRCWEQVMLLDPCLGCSSFILVLLIFLATIVESKDHIEITHPTHLHKWFHLLFQPLKAFQWRLC